MRFKIDENLPAQVARALRSAGHDATTVGEQGMAGCLDGQLAQRCGAEARVLVRLDGGFADIRAHQPGEHAGLIVLRRARQSVPAVMYLIQQVTDHLDADDPRGALWLVGEAGIRIRSDA